VPSSSSWPASRIRGPGPAADGHLLSCSTARPNRSPRVLGDGDRRLHSGASTAPSESGQIARPGSTGWLRALQAFLAILSFIVGVYLIGHAALSLLVLAILLGAYWMVHDIVELFVAVGHAELPGRSWLILSGVLSIVAGAIVAVAPGISLLALTIILGVWLIAFGVMAVIRSLQVRSAASGLRSRTATA
jgi:Short repeat of unknown function (DUF308)